MQYALTMAMDDEEMKLIIVTLVIGSVLTCFVVGNLRKVLENRERERTKREVAAYVAEGSIRPEHAVLLIGGTESDAERRITDAVTWGFISPDKAEQLIRAMRNDRTVQPEPART